MVGRVCVHIVIISIYILYLLEIIHTIIINNSIYSLDECIDDATASQEFCGMF